MSMPSTDSARSVALQLFGGIIAAIVLAYVPDPEDAGWNSGWVMVIAAVVAIVCIATLYAAQFRNNTDGAPTWWSVFLLPVFVAAVSLFYRVAVPNEPFTIGVTVVAVLLMLVVMRHFFRRNRKPAESPPDDPA